MVFVYFTNLTRPVPDDEFYVPPPPRDKPQEAVAAPEKVEPDPSTPFSSRSSVTPAVPEINNHQINFGSNKSSHRRNSRYNPPKPSRDPFAEHERGTFAYECFQKAKIVGVAKRRDVTDEEKKLFNDFAENYSRSHPAPRPGPTKHKKEFVAPESDDSTRYRVPRSTPLDDAVSLTRWVETSSYAKVADATQAAREKNGEKAEEKAAEESDSESDVEGGARLA